MTEKTKAILDGLVEKITSDTASEFVRERIELFSDGSNIPCHRWSMMNQFSVFLSGTHDARGIKQWNSAGRKVKKGAKALYIFVPMIYPKKEKSESDDETNPKQSEDVTETDDDDKTENAAEKEPVRPRISYKEMPVFRVEDTEGKPLDYEERIKALDVESLPLIEVAKSLGVKVEAGLTDGGAAGWFQKSTKKIRLGSANPIVFLHELSHAIDDALPDKSSSYAFNEVVAELSAAFLASLYGVKFDIALTQGYIKYWQGKGHVAFMVMDALQRVEQIYKFIESKKSRRIKSARVRKTKTPRKAAAQITKSSNIIDASNLFAVKRMAERSQSYNPKIGKWVKRDERTGLFCAVKHDGKPFSRVSFETMRDLAAYHAFDDFDDAS
jgi:antirestriction protein ArdC